MTFFITSVGGPFGANFGGLEGADRHCQTLAAKAGAGGKTWRAYLSMQAVGGAHGGQRPDRIGKGPWVNARGVQIAASVEDLHSRQQQDQRREPVVAETGRLIPSRLFIVNQHDILTGTQADGTAFAAGQGHDLRQLDQERRRQRHGRPRRPHGPARRRAPRSRGTPRIPSRGCDAASLVATGGAGLLYCFAAD